MTEPPTDLADRADASVDGAMMDCGSGLLLLLTRHMRLIEPGQHLLVRTEESTVPADLADWSRLAGHVIVGQDAQGAGGPWHILVQRGGASRSVPRREPPSGETAVFTTGEATPLGQRLWIYTNFHCNLACSYCCAESSPRADPRLMPVELSEEITAEFVALGGAEVYVTGGEPFLHPQIGGLVRAASRLVPATILTNAMVFDRGSRRAALESLDRSRVTLQVSLDSAGPDLHDRHRGVGSHAKALRGIELAQSLGFAVRVAATWYDDDTQEADDLNRLLDTLAVPTSDRLLRPVARQGFADNGAEVTVDSLAPEPTVTVDGIWWHPVAVTDPSMLVTAAPLPFAEALATIRDVVAVQDAARGEGRRHVFRCA